METEDDLFFAHLSKQISLLIMDDGDDDDQVARYPSISCQAFSRENYIYAAVTPSPIFEDQKYRRESKGTGVFIPQPLRPGRKHNRKGRFSSLNSSKSKKKQQQLDNTRFISQASCSSSNDAFHP